MRIRKFPPFFILCTSLLFLLLLIHFTQKTSASVVKTAYAALPNNCEVVGSTQIVVSGGKTARVGYSAIYSDNSCSSQTLGWITFQGTDGTFVVRRPVSAYCSNPTSPNTTVFMEGDMSSEDGVFFHPNDHVTLSITVGGGNITSFVVSDTTTGWSFSYGGVLTRPGTAIIINPFCTPPTSTPVLTATPTITPRATATTTPRPTATVTPKPTATVTPKPTTTPTVGPGTPTVTPNPTATVTLVPTLTPTITPTPIKDVNIQNLDFEIAKKAIIPPAGWWQAIGLDARNDQVFNDNITSSPTCGNYSNIPGTSSTPGLVFIGNTTANFGNGSASAPNWIVGGNTNPELFANYPPGNQSATSFANTLSKAKSMPITDATTFTGCSDPTSSCSLPNSLNDGKTHLILINACPAQSPVFSANDSSTYQCNGGETVNFTGATFTNGNFVVLVRGSIDMNGKIITTAPATSLFSVSNNVSIDPTLQSVGAGTCTDPADPQIETIVSADMNFSLPSIANCMTNTPDGAINMQGGIVVNAARSGGGYSMNRTLCTNNSASPVFTIRERPDFIINYPEFLKNATTLYTEVAP